MTMSSVKETMCSQPSCPGHKITKKNKSYALRECSIQKRKDTEKRKNQPKKRGPKPRPKSAPMSKYRRRTANLRERLRMGEINTAFENLRQKLPNPVQADKGKCEKLTKINILHVAINYIRAMENLLETGDPGVTSFSEMTKNPLRDEGESKLEMQRILAVLMKKAETKAALEKSMTPYKSNGRRNKYSTDEDDDLNDNKPNRKKSEPDEENTFFSKEENNLSFSDWNSISSTLVPFPNIASFPKSKSVLPSSSEAKFSTLSHSTPFRSSPGSFISSTSTSPSTLSNVSLDNVSLLQGDLKGLQEPMFNLEPAVQSSEDMIKELFTDFVDIVDTLPDIDFEEHFEMFP